MSEIAGGALSIVGLQFFMNSLESLDAWMLQLGSPVVPFTSFFHGFPYNPKP